MARNDTILRKIEIAENQMRKKKKLNELLRNVFIIVTASSIIPGLFMVNMVSKPISLVLYILLLLATFVYVVYEYTNMKHERNPLSIREKLFSHPDMKMIFQSKILSDMEDVDDKIDELESLVKTVDLSPEMMKEYIDDQYE
jgi:Ca2+/Na+ antiporter